jgi:Zn-dependent protease with chaperone function
MSFAALGLLGVLAAFGIGSLAASLLAGVAWRLGGGRLAALPAAVRARVLLAMRLAPTVTGIFASIGLALPAYLILEPYGAGEIPGWTFWICAAAGAIVGARGIWRLVAAIRLTRSIVRGWTAGARPASIPGVPWPVLRVESEAPVVALAGSRRPRLFIAGSVLDACRPELVSAMVAHEVGHWRADDNVKRLALEGAGDPLTLFASGRGMLEAWDAAVEEAADDDAIASGALPEDLAESLLQVVRLAPQVRFPDAVGAAAFYRGEAFERRVRRILTAPRALAHRVAAKPSSVLRALAAGALWLATASLILEPVHRLFENVVHAP